jgi:hypothetical protein
MRGKGGNASGTGAGYLYWYYTIQPPESGGIAGGAGIFGSAIIKSTGVVG